MSTESFDFISRRYCRKKRLHRCIQIFRFPKFFFCMDKQFLSCCGMCFHYFKFFFRQFSRIVVWLEKRSIKIPMIQSRYLSDFRRLLCCIFSLNQLRQFFPFRISSLLIPPTTAAKAAINVNFIIALNKSIH